MANTKPLSIEQAADIAESFDDFGVEMRGFSLNKVLPLEVCQSHTFWQEKLNAQQRVRQKTQEKAGKLPLTEIPDLIGGIEIDGFLREVSVLLHKRDEVKKLNTENKKIVLLLLSQKLQKNINFLSY